MPRWDFKKFELVKKRLGSTMKSVGEVMAIGRSFEEVLQKAIRMCDNGKYGLVSNSRIDIDGSANKSHGTTSLGTEMKQLSAPIQREGMGSKSALHPNSVENRSNLLSQDVDSKQYSPLGLSSSLRVGSENSNRDSNNGSSTDTHTNSNGNIGTYDLESIEQSLLHPTDEILFDVVKALNLGMSVERVNSLSSIDPWFLHKIQTIIMTEKSLRTSDLDKNILLKAKKLGFSDVQIANCCNINEIDVRSLRTKLKIQPVTKQIDTLAAEWPAKTNYLYLTYGGQFNDVHYDSKIKDRTIISKLKASKRTKDMPLKVIVLGAGPYRIGSSVEFDWGTVNMVWGLKDNGCKEVTIINCNPETVSTDYDICDRLYFEELTYERVMDICERENSDGIVTCVGGQTANILAPRLASANINILGTSATSVDQAEDRSKFGKLLTRWV